MLSELISYKLRQMLTEERVKFNMDVPEDIKLIEAVFDKNGRQLYICGGAVRDAVLGVVPKDFDLVTNAVPDEVIRMLKGQPFVKNIIETGKSFGVINVLTPNDEYEIATLRKDIGIGRRPDSVEFTGIEEDAKRRDVIL